MKLTTEDKMKALQQSPEIRRALALFIAAFNDLEFKTLIRFGYEVEGTKYELMFYPIRNHVVYTEETSNP